VKTFYIDDYIPYDFRIFTTLFMLRNINVGVMKKTEAFSLSREQLDEKKMFREEK